MLKLEDVNLAVVGLDNVGLPLAGEFGQDAALYFSPFDSKNVGNVLAEALSTPELFTKLSSAAVLQSGKFDWESTSKKTWSELLALDNRSKEGVC